MGGLRGWSRGKFSSRSSTLKVFFLYKSLHPKAGAENSIFWDISAEARALDLEAYGAKKSWFRPKIKEHCYATANDPRPEERRKYFSCRRPRETLFWFRAESVARVSYFNRDLSDEGLLFIMGHVICWHVVGPAICESLEPKHGAQKKFMSMSKLCKFLPLTNPKRKKLICRAKTAKAIRIIVQEVIHLWNKQQDKIFL